MLMGCRELQNLEGHNAIIEGYSFFNNTMEIGEVYMPLKISELGRRDSTDFNPIGLNFLPYSC